VSDEREEDPSQMFEPRAKNFDAALDPKRPQTAMMVKYFFKLSFPVILSNFVGYSVLLINSAIASKLNDSASLAAVGLGNVTSWIFIVSILVGLNSGQETLTSQAYGSGNFRLCGVYLNRGALVLIAFFIPLTLPGVFAERLFLALGQNPDVARLAQDYIHF